VHASAWNVEDCNFPPIVGADLNATRTLQNYHHQLQPDVSGHDVYCEEAAAQRFGMRAGSEAYEAEHTRCASFRDWDSEIVRGDNVLSFEDSAHAHAWASVP